MEEKISYFTIYDGPYDTEDVTIYDDYLFHTHKHKWYWEDKIREWQKYYIDDKKRVFVRTYKFETNRFSMWDRDEYYTVIEDWIVFEDLIKKNYRIYDRKYKDVDHFSEDDCLEFIKTLEKKTKWIELDYTPWELHEISNLEYVDVKTEILFLSLDEDAFKKYIKDEIKRIEDWIEKIKELCDKNGAMFEYKEWEHKNYYKLWGNRKPIECAVNDILSPCIYCDYDKIINYLNSFLK